MVRADTPSPQRKRPAAAPHGALTRRCAALRRNRRDGGAHALGAEDIEVFVSFPVDGGLYFQLHHNASELVKGRKNVSS